MKHFKYWISCYRPWYTNIRNSKQQCHQRLLHHSYTTNKTYLNCQILSTKSTCFSYTKMILLTTSSSPISRAFSLTKYLTSIAKITSASTAFTPSLAIYASNSTPATNPRSTHHQKTANKVGTSFHSPKPSTSNVFPSTSSPTSNAFYNHTTPALQILPHLTPLLLIVISHTLPVTSFVLRILHSIVLRGYSMERIA